MTMAYFTKCDLIQVDEDKNAELTQEKALVQQGINKEVQRKKNGKS